MTTFTKPGADQLYRFGPETLVAESQTIVAGTVAHYAKTLISASAGEPIPLTWTISGAIEQPLAIKGTAPAPPIAFSREERSILLPPDPTLPVWQANYGETVPDGMVVAFYRRCADGRAATVLPGGDNPTAFVTLLQNIVAIQAIEPPDRQAAAWLDALQRDHADEARRVALRSLIRLSTPWPTLTPALDLVVADATTDLSAREFLFGIIAFAIVHEKFAEHQADALRFLCREFLAAQDARLVLHYILHLKRLLRYTGQSEGRQARLPLEQQVLAALNQRKTMGPMAPELVEQYRQIRETHPGIH